MGLSSTIIYTSELILCSTIFWKSIVKTKHQSLTSLAFIRFVPGADRVVRHICIRCMKMDYMGQELGLLREPTPHINVC